MTNTAFNDFKNFVAKQLFTTTALPYANGPLHIGHLYEAILADIYAKFTQSPLISGDDQHGAAITLYTLKNNINVLEHIENQKQSHIEQYNQLRVNFDYFGQTHSELHTRLVQHCFTQLKNSGHIFSKPTLSWYDEKTNQFLPDRYVRGVCPGCLVENAFAPVCEACGASFDAKELLRPISVISNEIPVLKKSTHFFLNTENFLSNLKKLLTQGLICESAKNKVQEVGLGLVKDFDITRDNPYFGIPVPFSDNQSFYVWFDAPIAYISFVLEYLNKKYKDLTGENLRFEQLLELIPLLQFKHVIGKDIVYFHTYFWLNLINLFEPNIRVNKIQVHGWIVNAQGNKYSKSAGDAINLAQFSEEQLDAIRLYFFSIYEEGIQDHVFSYNKAYELYNQLIVGKFINIYSRVSALVESRLDGRVYKTAICLNDRSLELTDLLETFEFKKAFQLINSWLGDVNQYIQDTKPWQVQNKEELNEICFNSLHQFKLISKYVGVICPFLNDELQKIDYLCIKKQKVTERIKISNT